MIGLKMIKEEPPLSLREKKMEALDHYWNPNVNMRFYHEFMIKKILTHFNPHQLCIADLGCGNGSLALLLAENNLHVTAIDGSKKALKNAHPHPLITYSCDLLPFTLLNDTSFDGVILSDVIGEIPEQEHRLIISELARLLKKEGIALVATPLDIHSYDALEQLIALFQTEFTLIDAHICYHQLIRWIPKKWHFSWMRTFCDFLKIGQPTYALLIGKLQAI